MCQTAPYSRTHVSNRPAGCLPLKATVVFCAPLPSVPAPSKAITVWGHGKDYPGSRETLLFDFVLVLVCCVYTVIDLTCRSSLQVRLHWRTPVLLKTNSPTEAQVLSSPLQAGCRVPTPDAALPGPASGHGGCGPTTVSQAQCWLL